MIGNIKDNSISSINLYELNDEFKFLTNLYTSKKFPKVLMLSGPKGSGKFTLINHLMNFVYDPDNYNSLSKTINDKSSFYKQNSNNLFSQIIHLTGDFHKNVKIEEVRELKNKLLKSTISNKERFIILDDVELFNSNSLNALLKIIEEPSKNNYFILINNKTKPLIDTIYSRSLELKINLSNNDRIKIIEILIKNRDLDLSIDYKNINLSPGNFILFNNILKENNIMINHNFLANLEKITSLYKKNKDINLINLILHLIDIYFHDQIKIKKFNFEKIIENKNFVIDNINKFFIFNLNQNSLITAINNKINYE